jgi:hypothetical protein
MMFDFIPQKRAFYYLLVLGLIPICFSLFNYFSNQSRISTLQSSLENLQQLALLREKKQAANMAIRNHYRDADHFYIDKYLETLIFLEPEIESLQKILSNKNVADDEQIKKRLEYLTGPGNSFAFSEGIVQSSPFFQETTETLIHPVEINVQDLQKVLSRIEGLTIGPYAPSPNRPQLLVLDFKLDRKSISDKNEAYQLNLKLLKREFL